MTISLSQKAYDYLHEKLSKGELKPGSRIVNRTLAEQIGVSVIPVREAISRLASEGLIDQVPGAGAFVRDIGRVDLENLYVLRDALESCAAAEAAKHITSEQLEEFEYIVARFRTISDKIAKQSNQHGTKAQMRQWIDDEQAFHELLFEASRNPLLAKVAQDNRAIYAVFQVQRNDPSLLTADVAAKTVQSKAELIEALRERNHESARKLMSEQIQRGRQTVAAHFNRRKLI